jgi:hypothetical protein
MLGDMDRVTESLGKQGAERRAAEVVLRELQVLPIDESNLNE